MNARPATYNAADQGRRAALGKVHIAKKELGLDEGSYRAVLTRITGKDSAGACSAAELGQVLDEFKAKGWKPAVFRSSTTGKPVVNNRKPRPADHPVAKKARALWISLWQLGVVADSSETALEAFAKRQLRVDRLQWADQAEGYKLIEALKAMAERHGWSQDLAGVPPRRQVRVLKERLLAAQIRLLVAHSSGTAPAGFEEEFEHSAKFRMMLAERREKELRNPLSDVAVLSDERLDGAIKANGPLVRSLGDA